MEDIRRVKHRKDEEDGDQHDRDWTRLPEGVVTLISDKLPLYDHFFFTLVCKLWKSYQLETLRFNPQCGFPWLVLPLESDSESESESENENDNEAGETICISVLENDEEWELVLPNSSGGILWGCINDWLIMVKLMTPKSLSEQRVSLLNPFLGSEVVLPSICSSFNSKVVFSGTPGRENCVYMSFRYQSSIFAAWIPKVKDWSISFVKNIDEDKHMDLICSNGYFYLLTRKYNIRVFNAKDVHSTLQTQDRKKQFDTQFYEVEMSSDIPRQDDYNVQIFRYLVEFCGGILLVLRFSRNNFKETYDFKTFRLDLDKRKWVKLDSLEDYVLFLGRNCSRCYPAEKLDVEGNCVYFTYGSGIIDCSDSENILPFNEDTEDWGIFRLNNEGSQKFIYHGKKKKRTPIWLTAPLWWYIS